MEKNVRLVNIYIKIHNKHALTMDDMTFLAKWDPECFAKTCHNLVYNIPATKKLMQPVQKQTQEEKKAVAEKAPKPLAKPELSEKVQIQNFLANLKKLELNDLQVQDVSAENVKSLMGNLFMEMMFPHNDLESHFYVQEPVQESVFNKRV
ncbi:MAG: hypothetical protein NC417_12345 [Candidatus Gastranaerophilales bacterium]|nr:hypothetical protein [Candidatus Gastranaerophilales bacterium]